MLTVQPSANFQCRFQRRGESTAVPGCTHHHPRDGIGSPSLFSGNVAGKSPYPHGDEQNPFDAAALGFILDVLFRRQ